MEQKSITALMCLYVRAYMSKNSSFYNFKDKIAEKIITENEFNEISKHLSDGIKFFDSTFNGNEKEALNKIVCKNLAPTILARSIFAEKTIQRNLIFGLSSCLVLGSGYDTIAYKNYNLNFYEFDTYPMIKDKIQRLEIAKINHQNVEFVKTDFSKDDFTKILNETNIDFNKMCICLMLGVSQYLLKADFFKIIKILSSKLKPGSMILFDYLTPNQNTLTEKLANGANEKMKSFYTFYEFQTKLQDYNLLAYEHLNSTQADKFFDEYNLNNQNNTIVCPKDTEYILFVKK